MTHSTHKTAIITIVCVWILAGIMLTGATSAFAQTQNKGSDIYTQLSTFTEVLQKVKQYYVTELDDEELIKAAIIGMLGNTDPHTSYFTKDEFSDFTTSTRGALWLGHQIDKIEIAAILPSKVPVAGWESSRADCEGGRHKHRNRQSHEPSNDARWRRTRWCSRPVWRQLQTCIIRKPSRCVPYFFKLDDVDTSGSASSAKPSRSSRRLSSRNWGQGLVLD